MVASLEPELHNTIPMTATPAICAALQYHPEYDTERPWFEHRPDMLTNNGRQHCPYVRPEPKETRRIRQLKCYVPVARPLVYLNDWHCRGCGSDYHGELKHRQLKDEVTRRSRFPAGGKQELWGILVSYNLLRKEMVDIAGEAGVIPTRISFVAALNILVSQVRVSGKGATGNIPKHLKGMRENVKAFILPEKRKHRRYDRTVLYIPPKYPFSFKSREA